MAKLNVKEIAGNCACKPTIVEYEGTTYEITAEKPRVGDLVQAKDDGDCDITTGGFYEVVDADGGYACITDDVGDENTLAFGDYETFAKQPKKPPQAPRLKKGDLARVVRQEHEYRKGDVIIILGENDGYFDYEVEKICADHHGYANSQWIEPYTPAEGDALTIAGVDYVLRKRKAALGEKVLVTANRSGHCVAVNDLANITSEHNDQFMKTDRAESNCYLRTDEYLVLEPASKPQPSDDVYRYLITTCDESSHIITSDIADTGELFNVMKYVNDGFLRHEDVVIPLSAFLSIVKLPQKEAQ